MKQAWWNSDKVLERSKQTFHQFRIYLWAFVVLVLLTLITLFLSSLHNLVRDFPEPVRIVVWSLVLLAGLVLAFSAFYVKGKRDGTLATLDRVRELKEHLEELRRLNQEMEKAVRERDAHSRELHDRIARLESLGVARIKAFHALRKDFLSGAAEDEDREKLFEACWRKAAASGDIPEEIPEPPMPRRGPGHGLQVLTREWEDKSRRLLLKSRETLEKAGAGLKQGSSRLRGLWKRKS